MKRSAMYTWAPRVLVMGMVVFLSLFALDALHGEAAIWHKLVDLSGHLIPAALCLLALVFAWERPWVGALTFAVFAVFYGWYAWDRLDWVLLIAGPLVLVSALYIVSAFQPRRRPN